MNETLSFGLMAFTSFFTLLNPLGTMPVFLTMTANLSPEERTKTARKAIITAIITLIAFSFSGKVLFEFFGISIHAFRVVGGIIFFLMGQDMLQARLASTKINEEDIKSYVNDISITPLAIPMIAGPGSITNGIILMQDAHSVTLKITLVIVIVVVLLLTFVILWSSTKLVKFLGETGNMVLMRLMGLIVMVIAVEFLFSGLSPMIREMLDLQ